MPKRLILNADDFGLTPGINRAVEELFQAGALTSATLMSSAPAFEAAVAIAKANPGLGVGCHVVLTDGVPLSPPETIPSLLDPASSREAPSFRQSLVVFLRAALLGEVRAAEIEREVEAQITRIQAAGLAPTHVDTHKHTHVLPMVLRPLLRVAARLGIPSIRNPFEAAWCRALAAGGVRRAEVRLLNLFEPSFRRSLAASSLSTTEGCLGVSATGSLQTSTLEPILQNMPDGTWELLCHPGYVDTALSTVQTRLRRERELELDALLRLVPRWSTTTPGAELLSFRQIPATRNARSQPEGLPA